MQHAPARTPHVIIDRVYNYSAGLCSRVTDLKKKDLKKEIIAHFFIAFFCLFFVNSTSFFFFCRCSTRHALRRSVNTQTQQRLKRTVISIRRYKACRHLFYILFYSEKPFLKQQTDNRLNTDRN